MQQKKWQKAFPQTPESFHKKIEATLASLPDVKEKEKMRIKKRFAVPVVALVVVLALGTGLLATGPITKLLGSSSPADTLTQLPTEEQLQEDLNYVPKIPAEFSNGYTFDSATVGTSKGVDADDNVVDKHKDIRCDYQKGDDIVSLDISKWSSDIPEDNAVTETYNDIDLYYSSALYKYVPGDYVMTDQDKEDEKSGKYIFSFGTSEVSIQQVQSVVWVQDGITYDILAFDSSLTQDDFLAMAQEVIDQ